MEAQTAQPEQVTTTIGSFYDTPTTVALIFAVAGAFFVGLYVIRRIRGGSKKA